MKVVYLGADEDFEVEGADGPVTFTQGSVTEVEDALVPQLRSDAPHLFWFGDEPEPQHRPEGAETLVLDDGVRQEMIEGGAVAAGVTVEQAMAQVTPVPAAAEPDDAPHPEQQSARAATRK